MTIASDRMMALGALLSTFVAAAGAASGADAVARWQSGEWIPHLELRVPLERAERALAVPEERSGAHAALPCLPELCPPPVEVPGMAIRAVRPSRTELFANLLDRAGVEPFATIAWAFVATGLRVDWSPPVYDAGDPAALHRGWGSFFVRLRLRVDAMNRPAIPPRHGQRQKRSWAALMAPRF